jgi:hypothetical protein
MRTLFLSALIVVIGSACSPPSGTEIPPSAAGECPVELGGEPWAPLVVDPHLGLVPTDGDACPAGAEPHPDLGCADVAGPCGCRLICDGGCSAQQLCVDDGGEPSCTCHPSYEPTESGCAYAGVVASPELDDDEGWCLITSNNEPGGATAEIADGELVLRVTQLCSAAVAETVARLPARSDMPSGAALLMEYLATEATPDQGQPYGFQVHLGSTFSDVPAAAEAGEYRHCVRLEPYAQLTSLAITAQALGACARSVDWELRVSALRLVEDPTCD